MNYSETLSSAVTAIQKMFPKLSIEWQKHCYGGDIHVFFIQPENVTQLDEQWEPVTSAIAGEFQTKLSSEYEIWNLYLFFIVREPVNPQIKYRIENDTFSSRKIVIDKEQSKEEILIDHIFNSNLEPEKPQTKESMESNGFDHNPLIYDIVKDKVLRNKKRLSEAETSFDKLLATLKSQQ